MNHVKHIEISEFTQDRVALIVKQTGGAHDPRP
jgi:hypothetical protein